MENEIKKNDTLFSFNNEHKEPVLKITTKGEIYANGKLTDDDKEIADAMRTFAKAYAVKDNAPEDAG